MQKKNEGLSSYFEDTTLELSSGSVDMTLRGAEVIPALSKARHAKEETDMNLAPIAGLFGLLISLVSCEAARQSSFEDYRMIDLSYTFDADTLYWPTEGRFDHERTAWGITAGGYWYSSFRFAGSEHGGTHLDAPIHFSEGKWGVAEIPVDRLAGPGVVIDVTAQCESDPDYLLSVADIDAHEAQHGPIPSAAAVLVKTGWGSRWPDAKSYLGSDVPGDTLNLHFPGVSAEAGAGPRRPPHQHGGD